jgi:DNA primase large subunit
MDASTRGRIASYSSWGNTADRTARTAPARAALERKFLDQVPDHITDPMARALAAESIRQAYYLRLAAKSADSRAPRLRERAEAAEAELTGGPDAG